MPVTFILVLASAVIHERIYGPYSPHCDNNANIIDTLSHGLDSTSSSFDRVRPFL